MRTASHLFTASVARADRVTLGHVHRHVGVPQELLGSFLGGLPGGDADARAHEQLTVVEMYGASKSLQDFVGDHPREWDIWRDSRDSFPTRRD
jgi:hypothetical protein